MLQNITEYEHRLIERRYKEVIDVLHSQGRQLSRAKQLCFCAQCLPMDAPTDVDILQHIIAGSLLSKSATANHRNRNPQQDVLQIHPTDVIAFLPEREGPPSTQDAVVGSVAGASASAHEHQALEQPMAGLDDRFEAVDGGTLGMDVDVGESCEDMADVHNSGSGRSCEHMDTDSVDTSDTSGTLDEDTHQYNHLFVLPKAKQQCEARLPGTDGAEVRGCAGTEQGHIGSATTQAQKHALGLMFNVFALQAKWGLVSGAVKDLMAMLKNSKAIRSDVQSLLPDGLSDMMTRIGQVAGIRSYRYDVCPKPQCRQLFRCNAAASPVCLRCGKTRAKNSKDCCFYYNSISALLRKICESTILIKLLRYPTDRRKPPPGEIHDIYDTDAWASTMEDELLCADPRTVVLSFSQDGVQPFKDHNTASIEPFTVTILNFPPWMRSIPGIGTFLIGLPNTPRGQDKGVLHPYWEPFVDEVNYLYLHGMQCKDPTANNEVFTLRVGVLCGSGGGIMDSRGWPKSNLLQGPGAKDGCFCCTNQGFHAPQLGKMIYPLVHCYLPDHEVRLRTRCSELNNPSKVASRTTSLVVDDLDFSPTAHPPPMRDADTIRRVAVRLEKGSMAMDYR